MALTNATLSWTLTLARLGPVEAVKRDRGLASAANILAGRITYKGVADAFGAEFVPAEEAAGRMA
jgi:alanine dehydrogenase